MNNSPQKIQNSRFGLKSKLEIRQAISENVPVNTIKSKSSVWNQFSSFLLQRGFTLKKTTSIEEIASILEDYAFNMKKQNGDDYKELSIKSIWNSTAQMVQDKFYKEFDIQINPFSDLAFKSARLARDTKRKQLQAIQNKRKVSSAALTVENIIEMAKTYDEEHPEGLQKKIFHLYSFELTWRGNEAVNCKVQYFNKEQDSHGQFTGRIEYNPIFSKTSQGGSKSLTDSKWLVKNNKDESLCPVRLFLKLIDKRKTNPRITSDRLFLTVNQNWKNNGIWYKNMPLGVNNMSRWTQISAKKIGIDTKNIKITNHSHRSSAISALSKSGITDQQIIKISGHSNTNSLKPYIQLDPVHHSKLMENLRENSSPSTSSSQVQVQTNNSIVEKSNAQTINYHNCNFYFH